MPAPCMTSGRSRPSSWTRALNSALIEKAAFSGEVGFLASPVTGGGVSIGRIQQLSCGRLRADVARRRNGPSISGRGWNSRASA